MIAAESPPHPCPLSREGRGECPLDGHNETPLAPCGRGAGGEGASCSKLAAGHQKWLAENAAAIAAYNERAENRTILSDFERQF
jgi:hypothetical protein